MFWFQVRFTPPSIIRGLTLHLIVMRVVRANIEKNADTTLQQSYSDYCMASMSTIHDESLDSFPIITVRSREKAKNSNAFEEKLKKRRTKKE